MGLTSSSVFTKFFGKKQMRIVMVGLDGVGKTTILYRLKLGETVTTIPTIGYNKETIEYNNISFTFWDIGGGDKFSPLWRHYYQNTQGIIFTVDSSDTERISEVAYELDNMANDDQLQDAVILVFANKQDMPNAMTVTELTNALRLNRLKNKRWHIQPACATQGQGLYEGLNWLSNELAKGVENKQDLPNATIAAKLTDALNSYHLRNKSRQIQATFATQVQGPKV